MHWGAQPQGGRWFFYKSVFGYLKWKKCNYWGTEPQGRQRFFYQYGFSYFSYQKCNYWGVQPQGGRLLFLWIFTIGFFKCKKCNNIAIEGLSLSDYNHGDDKFKNLNLENSDVKTKWFGTRFF